MSTKVLNAVLDGCRRGEIPTAEVLTEAWRELRDIEMPANVYAEVNAGRMHGQSPKALEAFHDTLLSVAAEPS